jgi:hypothetical protein
MWMAPDLGKHSSDAATAERFLEDPERFVWPPGSHDDEPP